MFWISRILLLSVLYLTVLGSQISSKSEDNSRGLDSLSPFLRTSSNENQFIVISPPAPITPSWRQVTFEDFQDEDYDETLRPPNFRLTSPQYLKKENYFGMDKKNANKAGVFDSMKYVNKEMIGGVGLEPVVRTIIAPVKVQNDQLWNAIKYSGK